MCRGRQPVRLPARAEHLDRALERLAGLDEASHEHEDHRLPSNAVEQCRPIVARFGGTWQARNGLYLEDLYVTPEHRGAGVGRKLLRHLAQVAVAEGCGRFEWSVLDWNEPAIRVYDAIGAEPQKEWMRYRLAGDKLKAFAAG